MASKKMNHNPNQIYSTTILAVKRNGITVIVGDGQVTLGSVVMKATANKLRSIAKGQIIGGFAGAAADGFTLFERLESKLESYPGQLTRAAVELAKDWRSDKYLRKLEAMLIVCDKNHMLVLSGNGDVLEPEYDAIAIGSGSNYAFSAARALLEKTDLSAEEIAKTSLKIASDLCIYTNNNIVIQKIS
jgi:ATP-dependent HslUV protease subunit HslV